MNNESKVNGGSGYKVKEKEQKRIINEAFKVKDG